MKKMMLLALIAFIALYLYLFFKNPGCPAYMPKAELNLEKYFGTWYEMYRPYDANFETGECVVFETTFDDYEPDLYFKIVNSEQSDNGTRRYVQGRGQ